MDMRVFDLFKIGVGPSSSHTVGPMIAARRFLLECPDLDQRTKSASGPYTAHLALTGLGHATDKAVLLGLMGETPQDVAPDTIDDKLAELAQSGVMNLLGQVKVNFDILDDVLWHKKEVLPGHPKWLRFSLTRSRRQRSRTNLLLHWRRLHLHGRRTQQQCECGNNTVSQRALSFWHDGGIASAWQSHRSIVGGAYCARMNLVIAPKLNLTQA